MSLIEEITSNEEEEDLVVATDSQIQYVKSFIRNFRFDIVKVMKVKNSFLKAMYEIKKAEISCRFNESPEEKTLLHVTRVDRAKNIVEDNFDWRRVRRGKFGLGTSFSDDATYADRYANYDIGDKRAIVVARVLVTNTTWGDSDLEQLSEEYDTSTGNNYRVYVKFYDNEMLPLYVAYYNNNERRVFRTFNTYNVSMPPPDFRMLQSSLTTDFDHAPRHINLNLGAPTRQIQAEASGNGETNGSREIGKLLMTFTFVMVLGLLMHNKLNK